MTTMASGFWRATLRIIWRDLRSAAWVTEQVLMTYTSAAWLNSVMAKPISSKSSRIRCVSYWLTLHPRVVKAAVGTTNSPLHIAFQSPTVYHADPFSSKWSFSAMDKMFWVLAMLVRTDGIVKVLLNFTKTLYVLLTPEGRRVILT